MYEAGRDEDISIHALREEGDAAVVLEDYEETKFLSTPSARRATMYSARAPRTSRHFYPRPPRGGRPFVSLVDKAANKFLSTPSARRATSRARLFDGREDISIHALREEGDKGQFLALHTVHQISIHALREEGDSDTGAMDGVWDLFLSTPSARRATRLVQQGVAVYGISIHALREEGDQSGKRGSLRKGDFYPRPPRGGRPGQ